MRPRDQRKPTPLAGGVGDRTVGSMHKHRVAFTLLVMALAAAPLAGCGGSSKANTPAAPSNNAARPPSAPDRGAVKIHNFAFIPRTLTVTAGRVVVTNSDSTAHTVTADNGHSFDTGVIDAGSSSTLRVSRPGRYAYHCAIHPFMHGTLLVR
jgi:plastocyanin